MADGVPLELAGEVDRGASKICSAGARPPLDEPTGGALKEAGRRAVLLRGTLIEPSGGISVREAMGARFPCRWSRARNSCAAAASSRSSGEVPLFQDQTQ